MSESHLQRVYNYPIYRKGSRVYSDKVFRNIDNGSFDASRWTFPVFKGNESFYLTRFLDSQRNFHLTKNQNQ